MYSLVKKISSFIGISLLFGLAACQQRVKVAPLATASSTSHTQKNMENPPQQAPSLHNFSIKGIDGKPLDMANFKGKKILLVNVASECGYTKQYAQLEELYQQYKDRLLIIGFPCNDFGGQEPGTATEIQQFCSKNFGVTFPLTEKISIKKDTHPIFQWLTQQSQNGVMDASVMWNFHKFLIDENGHLVASFASRVEPFDEEITNFLK